MPQHLRALLSSSAQTANSLRQAQRIGGRNSLPLLPPACANLPPAALPQIECRLCRHSFLFAKKKQKNKPVYRQKGERLAIYHLEAKVVSRGAGRSAVAASAYLSCSCLYNDYDGIQHDYTKKQGLVWQEVFLPEYAPREWQVREKLWNAVEKVETAKDSRSRGGLWFRLP